MGLRNRDTRFARWAFSHAASFFWLVCGAVGQTPQRNPAPDVSGTQIAQLTQRAAVLDAQLTETRVMLAAVQLQFALAHGRPFPREWATLRDLAPPALLSNGMREPLTSHAARGVPAPAELRAGLAAQRDALLARSETGGWMDWAQGAMARFGLWDARVESSVAPVLQRMNQQLARGQIGAALTEAEALGPAALSALSAWLAQTRIVADGVVIAEHGRRFGRDPLICDPPADPWPLSADPGAKTRSTAQWRTVPRMGSAGRHSAGSRPHPQAAPRRPRLCRAAADGARGRPRTTPGRL